MTGGRIDVPTEWKAAGMHPEFAAAVRGHDLRHGEVRYGPEPDHVAEVLTPPEARDAPLVIVIHGGFWRVQYDRGHAAAQCVALAGAGYTVAALEYRRVGGGGGWPTTFVDVAAGVDAVPALLAGIADPDRTLLMGHSAGGHLALWAAARHRLPDGAPGRRTEAPWLRGVVALAAVADLGHLLGPGTGAGAVIGLLGVKPDADPEGRYVFADPARLLPTGIPTICVHGTEDEEVPIGCAAAYVDAARAAGDPAQLHELPGVGHFEPIDPTSTAWPAVLNAAAALCPA